MPKLQNSALWMGIMQGKTIPNIITDTTNLVDF